jgi:hypothetical protein
LFLKKKTRAVRNGLLFFFKEEEENKGAEKWVVVFEKGEGNQGGEKWVVVGLQTQRQR